MSTLGDLIRAERRHRSLPDVELTKLTDKQLLKLAAPFASAELQHRRISGSLHEWCLHCGFKPAAHHRLLISELEKVARGETPRLALFMPPGSAKSTYASILFPAWLLASASYNILAASHTTELAEKWGRRIRNLIAEHSATLRIALAADSQSAGRWSLQNGAEYYAAGVGTGIAGFRAKLGLIDDPIRLRRDADSQLIRDRIWDWYINDFKTRLVPHSAEILIQTRWHEDDLAGRALNHEEWKVISLPALAEANDPLKRKLGEPLWRDDDYGYGNQLVELSKKTPARTWSAMYQQRPAPEEGNYFKADWLRPYEKAPAIGTLNVYGASDYAVTADGGDYTVHIVVGVDPEWRIYVLDLWRAQAATDKWVEAFCDLVADWKPIGWAEEQGQINAGVGPFLQRRMRERKTYVARDQFPTRGDKAVRAQSIRGRMELDGLYVPVHALWYPDFRAELLSFPAGKHDDQVDALGLIGQVLNRMTAGQAEAKPEKMRGMHGMTMDEAFELATPSRRNADDRI
jgi:predicted phage terminase large subunit-like protein